MSKIQTIIDTVKELSVIELSELVKAFEEEFGAQIPEEDAEKLTSVGKVIDYLREKGFDAE